ncbi:hypothetical protein FRC02_007513 [Tulasnella sp. 418]|nr:hypothetical protein FRC02_007513 [Tulasnella sp. 418]
MTSLTGAPGPQEPPQLVYDGKSALPMGQLRSIKTHLQLVHHRIEDLMLTVLNQGRMQGTPWPEILNKYNNILQQTALITEQLTMTITGSSFAAAVAAAQNTAWPRPPINQIPNLLLHPIKPIPQEADHLFGSLLQTMRPPPVLQDDIEVVTKFEKDRERRGMKDLDSEGILREMEALRADHDAKAERGLRAVQMLKEKYYWRARPDFRAEEEELERQRQNVMESGPSLSRSVATESNDEEDEEETEDQVMVDRDASSSPRGQGPSDQTMAPAVNGAVAPEAQTGGGTTDNEEPLDSDDDLFEEVT